MTATKSRPLKLVVLISGGGSNLQSIIDQIEARTLDAEIVCVISDQPDAMGLHRAETANIATRVIKPSLFADRQAFDAFLLETLNKLAPDLVVLAGFMRVLGSTVVNPFSGRMINIHPSLLPAFPGLDTHRRAIEAGHESHGASVHFVTAELDGGPIIDQRVVPILANDTPQTLQKRVLVEEHKMLPEVIQWIASDRLVLLDGQVLKDNSQLQINLTNPA